MDEEMGQRRGLKPETEKNRLYERIRGKFRWRRIIKTANPEKKIKREWETNKDERLWCRNV